jgi:hypothetical protein
MNGEFIKKVLLSADMELFKNRVLPIEYRHRGILSSEGFAICVLCDFLGVDVLIESGTAYGRSTEIFGKYGIPKIYSIDRASLANWSKKRCDRVWNEVKDRLSIYSNIEMIKGNSFDIVGKLLECNKGKRIGLMIDGPKGKEAIDLAKKSLGSGDIMFVGIHDQKTYDYQMRGYFDNVVFTNQSWYKPIMSRLDVDDIEDIKKRDDTVSDDFLGFGLGLFVNR